MKAELNENGVMIIAPETPTEAYAVKQWASHAWTIQDDLMRLENGHWRGTSLIIRGGTRDSTQRLEPDQRRFKEALERIAKGVVYARPMDVVSERMLVAGNNVSLVMQHIAKEALEI